MNTKSKLIELKGQSPLKDYVINYFLEEDNIKQQMKDLQKYGCQSGMVGTLIYYQDTEKFYDKYKEEINELAYEIIDCCGYNSIFDLMPGKLDKEDQLFLQSTNKNYMAWFGFEEASYRLYEEIFEERHVDNETER